MNSPASSPINIWRWLIAWICSVLAFLGFFANPTAVMALPMSCLVLAGHYLALDSGGRTHNYLVCGQALALLMLLWLAVILS